jgi:hypothetical protein
MLPPSDIDARLFAKKVEVIADGICDALVLRFFKKQRKEENGEWVARQMRKVDGAVKRCPSGSVQRNSLVSVFKSSLLAHDQFLSAELRIITRDMELRDFSLR